MSLLLPTPTGRALAPLPARIRGAVHRWWVRNVAGGVHDHPEGAWLPETCGGCRQERDAR